MEQNTINNLEQKLKTFIGKRIIIFQSGFLEGKYFINKMDYFIENEILNIKDKESDNYLKINLNQVYQVENKEKEIKLFVDNDTTICLTN